MYRPRKENPSFSSSLLDEIYRSIDERDEKEVSVYRETTSQKHTSVSATRGFQNDRRETIEKIMVRRRSTPNFNSSSSSSGSSCGGGFSSSETESVYRISSRPKPIRTNIIRDDEHKLYGQKYQTENIQTISKHEGKFVKTKSRAMKIYGDLKKVKQPISPGGRLATFLNSIFNTKSKLESMPTNGSSTCSSASSFSRSCLSNTPSSRTKLNTNKKRSVRFFPMIVDEECKPCTQIKFVKNPKLEEKSRRIEEAARTLLRNYQKKVECEFDLSKGHNEVDMKYEDDDDEDDDDDVSNASSDLFELENFEAIGMEKYGDELPVYETTHLDMNLAIGNGFLM